MRINAFLATAVVATASVLFSNTAALADIIYGFAFHDSVENYFMTGTPGAPGSPTGTQVACQTGCADFNVPGPGLPNGNVFWEVHETGFYGTENDGSGDEFTKIEYAVFNDAFDPELITSFHVPTNGRVPVTILSPLNWSGGYSNGVITWVADSGFGIGAPAVFTAIYEGSLPIIFEPFVLVDLGNGSVFTSADWVVSTVPANGGGEGCTPGFWKQSQHFGSWPAPYVPGTLFFAVFDDAFPDVTLIDVMLPGGGNNPLRQLGRHAVAALLNAASPDVDYDLTVAEVITLFNNVFPGTNQEYNTLQNSFNDFNELGCALDSVPSQPTGCDNEDGVCAPGEDCESCPSDCDSKTNGRPFGRYCCGNGVPEGPEGDGRCDGNI